MVRESRDGALLPCSAFPEQTLELRGENVCTASDGWKRKREIGVRWMFRLAVVTRIVCRLGFWVGVYSGNYFLLVMFLSIVARILVFIDPIRDAFNDSYFQ
jgi:hypothetical protein